MMPSDLRLLLLWLVLRLEMKGNGAGNAKAVARAPGLLCVPRCPTPWTALLWEEKIFPGATALRRYHPALEGGKGRGQTCSSSLFIPLRGAGVSIWAGWRRGWAAQLMQSFTQRCVFPFHRKQTILLFSVVKEAASQAIVNKAQCALKKVAFSFLIPYWIPRSLCMDHECLFYWFL